MNTPTISQIVRDVAKGRVALEDDEVYVVATEDGNTILPMNVLVVYVGNVRNNILSKLWDL